MEVSEKLFLENPGGLELLSVSSNRVYRYAGKKENWIIKVNRFHSGNLSPFWSGMEEVFGWNWSFQSGIMEKMLVFLENPYIPPARLVAADRRWCQVFLEMEGIKYEPDEFPAEESTEYQLGQYIGNLHRKSFDYYGPFASEPDSREPFRERLLRAISGLIQRHWKENLPVREYFERVSSLDLSPSSFSLIMPDISANQFLFSPDLKAAACVVDFDAYVVGPREWELSILETCLSRGVFFKSGYEEFLPFPDLEGKREAYRFFSYLCDPRGEADLDECMNRNRVF